MTGRRIALWLVAFLVLLPFVGMWQGAPSVQADAPPQTHVGGRLTQNTDWTAAGSPYQMDANVLVPSGITLTIDPGAVIYATSGIVLQVKGILAANGTNGNPITFKYSPTAAVPASESCYGSTSSYSWCGIQFVSGADPGSSVTYVAISNAADGLLDYPAATLSDDAFKTSGVGIAYDANGPTSPGLSMQNDMFDTLNTGVNCACGTLKSSGDVFKNVSRGIQSSGTTTVTRASISASSVGISFFGTALGVSDSAVTVSSSSSNNVIGIQGSGNVRVSNSMVMASSSSPYSAGIQGNGNLSVSSSTVTVSSSYSAGIQWNGAVTASNTQVLMSGGGSGTVGVTGTSLSLTDTQVQGNGVGTGVSTNGSNSSLTASDLYVSRFATGLSLAGGVSINASFVTGNAIGLALDVSSTAIHIRGNDILNNGQYNISTTGNAADTVDAAGNWWGTTDPTAIQKTIQDCGVDLNRPCVVFSSPLSGPIECSTSATPTPTPAGTPVVTSTPASCSTSGASTVTPTFTSTVTPTVTDTAAATSTPTNTPGPGGSVTNTPTLTPTQTMVATITATSTNTTVPTPTNTATPIPTATSTPIPPGIAITPQTQTAGAASGLIVTGHGFGPGETVLVAYTATLVAGGTRVIQANGVAFGDGTLAIPGLSVPVDVAAGTYTVTATGMTTGRSATAPATILAAPSGSLPAGSASIALSPTSAMPGTERVVVAGSGFQVGEAITVSFTPRLSTGGQETVATSGSILNDGTTVVTGLFVPANAIAGDYVVTALGRASGRVATAHLTITAAIPTATVTPTATPTATLTTVPTPTNTPVPSPTPVQSDTLIPTATPVSSVLPPPSISFAGVTILVRTGNLQVPSQHLRLGQPAMFAAFYHKTKARGVTAKGNLVITRNGKQIASYHLTWMRLNGRTAFARSVVLYHSSDEGTLYAHFTLKYGSTKVVRSRKFYLAAH